MKRKSNEREIKIPVNTMADEVISHLGFVRTSKRVMPEPTKEEADKMAEVLHWFYRNHREEIDIMGSLYDRTLLKETAKENKRDMVLAVVVLGLICVAIIALAIYLRFFI